MRFQKVFGLTMSYDDYNGCEYLATNRPLLSLSPAILGMLKSFFWFLKGGRTYCLCYSTLGQFFNQDTKNDLDCYYLGLFEKNKPSPFTMPINEMSIVRH